MTDQPKPSDNLSNDELFGAVVALGAATRVLNDPDMDEPIKALAEEVAESASNKLTGR